MSDTFERSCEHWSEAGRAEMEAFYALATVDYRHLAEALDWKAWLQNWKRLSINWERWPFTWEQRPCHPRC